jgi:hypothetical protein
MRSKKGAEYIVNENYKIGSDKYNIILYERRAITGTQRNPNRVSKGQIGDTRWKAIGYYSSSKNALCGMVDHEIMKTGLTDIQTVLDKIDELEEVIKGLQLRGAPELSV